MPTTSAFLMIYPSKFVYEALQVVRLQMLIRHLVFHCSSHGSLTDISMNSNGDFGCLAWPTRKSRYFLSSTANAMNTRLTVATFDFFGCAKGCYSNQEPTGKWAIDGKKSAKVCQSAVSILQGGDISRWGNHASSLALRKRTFAIGIC